MEILSYRRVFRVLPVALVFGFLPACGSSQLSQVTVSSQPFAARAVMLPSPAPSGSPAPTQVTDFRVCVSRLILHGRQAAATASPTPSPSASPGPVADDDGDEDVDAVGFAPGLIDLSTGGFVNWAVVTIPNGFRIDEIRAKVHQDKALCGQDFSLSFDGMTTSEDIELRWGFAPPLLFNGSTSQLQLSLNEMLSALERAAAAGNPASLKTDVEGALGSVISR